MPYDTTGPVRVREKWSLVAMLAVMALAGGAVWHWGYWGKLAAPATTLPAGGGAATRAAGGDSSQTRDAAQVRAKVRRRDRTGKPVADPQGDYVRWPDELDNQGTIAIHSGNVYLNISLYINRENKKVVDAWWSYPRQEAAPRPWGTSGMVMRVIADPRTAARYDFTAEQIERLKGVKFVLPEIGAEDRKKMVALFLTAEAARADWRAKVVRREKKPSLPEPAEEKKKFDEAELALRVAAGKLAIPAAEMDAFDDAAEDAREILRPDQLDLIDSGFDRTDGGFDRAGYPRRRAGMMAAATMKAPAATSSAPATAATEPAATQR